MIFTLVEIDQISDCVEFLNSMYWIPIYMQRQDFQQNSNEELIKILVPWPIAATLYTKALHIAISPWWKTLSLS